MAQVRINRGYHGGREHRGITFNLVSGLRHGQKGPFLVVDGVGVDGFPQRNIRIHVDSANDFEIIGENVELYNSSSSGSTRSLPVSSSSSSNMSHFTPDEETDGESDDAIKARINERFEILSQMTQEIALGTIKGLVVYGAPGVGKSHGVEKALERDSLSDKLAFNPNHPDQDPRRVSSTMVNGTWQKSFNPRYKIIRGTISANGLYKTLFEYSEPNDVVVFDDTDIVLQDETCLNFLKVALDTTERRILHWITNSNRADALPNSFEFKGSVIFITNLNFEKVIASNYSKMSPHLEAILSRCLYLDLTIETTREKLLRIEHVAKDLGMLKRKGLSDEHIDEIMAFVYKNAERFRELSLRKVLQLSDIRKMSYNWERVAELTVLRK